MSLRKALVMAAAAVALVVGQSAVVSSASATAGARASALQQKIDRYVAQHPGTRQVGTDTVRIPGGTVTLAASGTQAHATAISCSNGWLCIQDGGGNRYDYYTCGYYDFSGIGDGVFNNNQTQGTVARFYNQDGSLRWTSTAKATGTASWTPVFHIRPC